LRSGGWPLEGQTIERARHAKLGSGLPGGSESLIEVARASPLEPRIEGLGQVSEFRGYWQRVATNLNEQAPERVGFERATPNQTFEGDHSERP
jgi:hypothetical protein